MSPHFADLILGFMAVEAILLRVAWRRPAGEIVSVLLPGACLVVALRAALAGAALPWAPLALLLALVAHIADMRRRLRD